MTTLALAGCPEPSPPPPEWQIAFEGLPAGLLSVWGTSASDVWTVGADTHDGMGPLVLHFDGTRWERILTGETTGDLWWVNGVAGGPVMVGGEGGMILSWDGTAFTRTSTPSDGPTVFGIWASSADDALAVGGLGRTSGFVWHWDGATWSDVARPTEIGDLSLFKVWGTAPDDAFVCGTDGTMLHWDGSALLREDPATTRTLFTVHAPASGPVVAVGGVGSAVLVERDEAGAWHDVAPDLTPQLFGVWLEGATGAAVGINGTIVLRSAEGWALDTTTPSLAETLHSTWIDPDGGIWSAGGQVLAEPLVEGILLYRGPRASMADATFTVRE
jgi:hypothetical protein